MSKSVVCNTSLDIRDTENSESVELKYGIHPAILIQFFSIE